MNIEELLIKYFEGETTCEEERELRHFFTQGIVPEHLKEHRPLFAFLEKENRQADHTSKKPLKHKINLRRRLVYAMGGIAAGVLLLIGIAGIHKHLHTMPEDYVIIDGKCYTDENLIREQATAAFSDVSFEEDEILQTLLNQE